MVEKALSSNYVCPNCGAQAISTFYEAENVPVHTCVMLSTRKEALRFPKGKIVLGFCKKCGFISNIAFDSSAINYSAIYEDQQSFSSTFNVFAENLAKHLIRKYNLIDKKILEIGCGKGDFLALLCELGNNSGVGIDPAYIKDRINSKASDRLTFIRDYYSEQYANHHGDLICCRHTLEHIPNTFDFLSSVRRAIDNRLDTVAFFEVPDVTRVLRELAFWDIYYEHCSYFSLGSLARLFRSCQFDIINLSTDFDDQYILIEAKPVSRKTEKVHEMEESIEELAEAVKYFATHCREKLDQWKNRLNECSADGKRVVVWGSGSKCVSFISTLGVKDEIAHVVDINPFRHGKYLPGIGKKVVSPEILRDYKPDVVIVMNRIYQDEICKMLDDMGSAPEVISV
ncbi:MAG TPA: methyltransferase domain-containing protein [Candidatus Bathyarchaeota archaeon]|nr:methyltransferase domain-containing protein [Candidatus Bathyarchaeota archaeon]